MELRAPRKKIKSAYRQKDSIAALPILQKSKGYFNGFSVIVRDPEEAKQLLSNGCFGKGNLSRSFPNFQRRGVEILRKRQFQARKALGINAKTLRKVIVVPDSDCSENESYFTDLKPIYEIDRTDFKENLHLSLPEAYFLCIDIECLEIYDENEPNKTLDKETVWNLFCDTDNNFIANYAAYTYFRVRNWVIKPGTKFGGDFLLYKQGSAFYHASYVVIIDIIDENLDRIDSKQRRCMNYSNLIGLNRLCETTGKELLICQLVWPCGVQILSSDDIVKLSINEVLMRRWIPTQKN